MRLPLFTLIVLSVIGVGFLSIMIHETVHLFQAEKVYSICYDFNQKSLMHVEADTGLKTKNALEFPAYMINMSFFVLLLIAIFFDFKRRFKEDD